MKQFWSDMASRLEPYVPGEQPKDRKYIKLNTNENPYGPSPKVLEAIRNNADDSLKLYPDPTCDMLLDAASSYYGVAKEQIFPGNGSDEVLAFAFMAFFNPGKEIVFPNITYSFYPVYARLFNLDYRQVSLGEDFELPLEEMFNSKGGVVHANPNAPTGKMLPLPAIRQILDNNPSNVVIIDEAYIDFGGETAIGLVNEYPNLLVVHTFSKSRALAGIRLGFAIGDRNLIEAINAVKNSFNSYTVDRLAIVAGVEAFRDKEYFEITRCRVMTTRDHVTDELRRIGFTVVDSAANFIFAGHPKVKAAHIFRELRAKGILVRYFNRPLIDNYLRITIGTDEEMESLLGVVSEIVHGKAFIGNNG